MKVDRLETHDRLLHFKKDQALNIAQGAEDCLKRNPLSLAIQSRSPYVYLFAHPRTADDGFTKRMLWQPRLTRPKAQTNSYLFRAQSNSDVIEVCWLLPPREMWDQYSKGKVTEDDVTWWSIQMFQNRREDLEKDDPEDLSEERCKMIMRDIAVSMEQENRMKKMYLKPETSEEFLI